MTTEPQPAHEIDRPMRNESREQVVLGAKLHGSARALSFEVESELGSSFLFEHDLFRKPVPTFRDHALESDSFGLNRLGVPKSAWF